MKTAVRVFALLVAFVGLASASFSSAPTQVTPTHLSSAVTGDEPDLPMPPPCMLTGTCVAPAQ